MTHTTVIPPRLANTAGEGRRAFVDAVLNDFVEDTGMSVPDTIRDFILNEVLVSDSEWDAAVRAGNLDPGSVHAILTQSLWRSTRIPREFGARMDVVDPGYAREAFHGVIRDRWKCPFPFIFC